MLFNAPVIKSFSKSKDAPNADTWELSGTAVSNSIVSLFDGTSLLGTTTADATGAWIFETGFYGIHNFTATAIDAAGNTSARSSRLRVNAPETQQAWSALATVPPMTTGTTSLSVDDTADHVINATEFGRCGLHGFRAHGRCDRYRDIQRYFQSSGRGQSQRKWGLLGQPIEF